MNLWSAGGYECCHSIDVGRNGENITGRLALRASQIIIINPITAMREIVDPIDETTFQVVKASG